jgi:hypothetical protein
MREPLPRTTKLCGSRCTTSLGARLTLAEINRMIRAAIRAARQEGAPVVEVQIGDDATVRIPLVPDKPIAEPDEVVL